MRVLKSFFTLGFCLVVSVVFAQVDLNNGLQAYYPFNGNANDATGHGNNPSLVNDVTFTSDYYGNPNSAAHFNGVSSFIQIPNYSSINFTGPNTICVWVKPEGFFKGQCHHNRIIMKGLDNRSDGNLAMGYSDHVVQNGNSCHIDTVDTLHQTAYGYATGITSGPDTPYIRANEWKSIVCTYDGTYARLYVNCELTIENYNPNITFSNLYDLFIGKMDDPQFPYFVNGIIDEVRIYNRALNTDEIKAYSFSCSNALPCSDWYYNTSEGGAFRAGDLDITGHSLTVEAEVNRTVPYNRPDGDTTLDGDVVSKHRNETDVNYLLRSNRCEITTTTGHYRTPPVCRIELDKTYHVAMTYDGQTLKFYRNGFMMSSVPATGDLVTNDYQLTIGSLAYQPGFDYTAFKGYINNVRLWNVVRTQSQIKTYMDTVLPNPPGQSGLLADYVFDNLANKQGNTAWNGNLVDGAIINQTNPSCGSFVADSCGDSPVIIPSFNAPDTVCVGVPFTVTNTTFGATTNYWSFCQPNLLDKPNITNLGNLGFSLNAPVYTDYVLVNGNYYMFLTNNNNSGSLYRLDFGNSLLNTPTAVFINNVSPSLGANTEGLQVVQNNGRWYAIIVGGDPRISVPSRIVKVDFGTSITNTSPVVTNWGNVGGLLNYPHELFLFRENNRWYGYTANTLANNIVKFDFGTDFSTTPTASVFVSDYMNNPVGFHTYSQDGKRYLFVANSGTSSATSSLVRLDFGSSYINTPTATNLGTLGGTLGAYDFTTAETCDQLIGMSVRFDGDVVARFTFPNKDITQTPVFLDTVASGQLRFPHSFSKMYRDGSDSYFFIPNASNNTLSRLKIAGCTTASPAGSNSANPGNISYNAPGTYNISLIVDDGLQTQAATCKNIVAVPIPKQLQTKDTSFCEGTYVRLVIPSSSGAKYAWNTGATDTAITVSQPGKYWVRVSNGGQCAVVDSFTVTTKANPVVNLGRDTGLCKNQTIVLNAGNTGSTYAWQDSSTKSTYTAIKGGTYYVTVTNAGKCSKADTVKIADYPSPVVTGLVDSKICAGNSAQLSITADGTGNTFSWSPSATLNNSTIANPTAKPLDTTNYIVTVTNATGCATKDTATVFVLPKPIVTSIADTGVCTGGLVVLQTTISNTTSYSWSPATGLDNASSTSPKATPTATTSYVITGTNAGCSVSDTVKLTVFALPSINAGNDTTVCGTASVQLSASGGNQYQWQPATGLSNASVSNPIASVNTSITYMVTGTDKNGCVSKDSLHITNRALTQFAAITTTPVICAGDSALLKASGGTSYSWQPATGVLHPNDSSTYATPKVSTSYSVQISDPLCKTSDVKQVSVAVNPAPQIKIIKSNDIDCRQQEATLSASGGISYTWSPDVTDSIAGQSSVKVMPEETTIYKVTATSNDGCVSTDTVTVKVNIDLAKQYPLQNAFSPNGDGINDCFGIKSWNVLKVDFAIFDQWGWMVFHSTDPNNVCWDGRYKGKNQLDGTYIYKIYAVTSCGIINKAGPLVLIRAAR